MIVRSVTRFDEISPLWQHWKNLWQCFEGLLSIWQNFEPTLANLLCYFLVLNGQNWTDHLAIWSHFNEVAEWLDLFPQLPSLSLPLVWIFQSISFACDGVKNIFFWSNILLTLIILLLLFQLAIYLGIYLNIMSYIYEGWPCSKNE